MGNKKQFKLEDLLEPHEFASIRGKKGRILKVAEIRIGSRDVTGKVDIDHYPSQFVGMRYFRGRLSNGTEVRVKGIDANLVADFHNMPKDRRGQYVGKNIWKGNFPNAGDIMPVWWVSYGMELPRPFEDEIYVSAVGFPSLSERKFLWRSHDTQYDKYIQQLWGQIPNFSGYLKPLSTKEKGKKDRFNLQEYIKGKVSIPRQINKWSIKTLEMYIGKECGVDVEETLRKYKTRIDDYKVCLTKIANFAVPNVKAGIIWVMYEYNIRRADFDKKFDDIYNTFCEELVSEIKNMPEQKMSVVSITTADILHKIGVSFNSAVSSKYSQSVRTR